MKANLHSLCALALLPVVAAFRFRNVDRVNCEIRNVRLPPDRVREEIVNP